MQKMLIPLVVLLPILQSCSVRTAVSVATDAAVEVAKVPFRVSGAAIVAGSNAVGPTVSAVTDTAVEVVKAPFKVGGAAIDVVKGDVDAN